MGGQSRPLDGADAAAWQSLGLAVTSADLVGVMRGAGSTLTTGYARSRRQYGAAIGSFQAVQHLLADAFVAMEGSRSVALHAAWAVDALPASEALAAVIGRQGLLCPGGPHGLRDGHSGARRHRQHLGVPGPRLPAPRPLSSDVLGGVGPNSGAVLAARDIGVDDGLR